jgi:hypothetical protein
MLESADSIPKLQISRISPSQGGIKFASVGHYFILILLEVYEIEIVFSFVLVVYSNCHALLHYL